MVYNLSSDAGKEGILAHKEKYLFFPDEYNLLVEGANSAWYSL